MSSLSDNAEPRKLLVIGYGNPGRQDDGLGPAFVDRLNEASLEQSDLLSLSSYSAYQLSVEDALEISEFDIVVFVDASVILEDAYRFTPVDGQNALAMGSHQLSPEAVLRLCHTLYGRQPEAHVLAIKGQEFDQFEEKLGPQAAAHLDQAYQFFLQWYQSLSTPVRKAQHA